MADKVAKYRLEIQQVRNNTGYLQHPLIRICLLFFTFFPWFTALLHQTITLSIAWVSYLLDISDPTGFIQQQPL